MHHDVIKYRQKKDIHVVMVIAWKMSLKSYQQRISCELDFGREDVLCVYVDFSKIPPLHKYF